MPTKSDIPTTGDRVRDNARSMLSEILGPMCLQAGADAAQIVSCLETAIFEHHNAVVSADYRAAIRFGHFFLNLVSIFFFF